MFSSKNSSCKAFNAFFTSFSSMMHEIFLSEAPCAITLILTLFFPSVLNILPLSPWWLFILSPTRATIAKSFSGITCLMRPLSISYSKASLTMFTAFSTSSAEIPTHIECSEDAWVINTTLISAWERTSKKRFEIPGIPTIPGPSKDNSAILPMWLIPRTVFPFSFLDLVINVPASSGLKVFFITIDMPFDNTGCIVGG